MDFLIPISIIASYLIGSLSSAIVICRLYGLSDPRIEGSKNPGATNVLRLGGKIPAALTLVADVAKGFLPVAIGKLYFSDPWVLSAILLAAVLGHIFPVFYGFKGGKGVATAWGALLGLFPILGGIFTLVWLLVFFLTRYSSLSSIIAIATIPAWAELLNGREYAISLGILALIVILRHYANISRLIAGTESKSNFNKG